VSNKQAIIQLLPAENRRFLPRFLLFFQPTRMHITVRSLSAVQG